MEQKGRTLVNAAWNGDTTRVKELLSGGVPVDAVDPVGYTSGKIQRQNKKLLEYRLDI